MAESQTAGAFNLVGPPTLLNWREMLATCATELRTDATFTWADDNFLTAQNATD